MEQETCPVCDIGKLYPSTWEMDEVELECCFCDHCGCDPIMPDQIRRNERKMRDAESRRGA
jgi:hypothetical protein